MQHDVGESGAPEEEELKEKQAELEEAQAELAQQELELTTLQADLAAFERRYRQMVYSKYSELDAIEAEMAQLRAQQSPGDPQARSQADEAQSKADESAAAAEEIGEEDADHQFAPTEDLKKLYRKVAKQVHPDLADGPEERDRRVRVMAEVNEAYSEGDEDRLRNVFAEWQNSPESVQGDDAAAKLVRVIRKLKSVRNRIDQVQRELAELKERQLYQLMEKARQADSEGRDLLHELANDIERRVTDARERRSEFRETGTMGETDNRSEPDALIRSPYQVPATRSDLLASRGLQDLASAEFARSGILTLIQRAREASAEIDDETDRKHVYFHLAKVQAAAGDVEGARRTSDEWDREHTQRDQGLLVKYIVSAQIAVGDITGAIQTAGGLRDQRAGPYRERAEAYREIVEAQTRGGDHVGAKSTAEQIVDDCGAKAEAQAQAGDLSCPFGSGA